ncbi:zinc finger with UFM1-specific peptidase domain [Seminavis robusta]|uniref:Zinc finger with UFM1-specific peptidase domain n=1 Tax=Seminavis robusta TaxID=568900 RepID=A0A9N8HX34_9STRA|nr:zinc finger with UFM1-specific peptidase domain [Seminavis robusta]|eukprot:Sro2374_g325330.1 zinc finger with UFM1-specific peptidase domain (461) ;mRNA; f:12499-13881
MKRSGDVVDLLSDDDSDDSENEKENELENVEASWKVSNSGGGKRKLESGKKEESELKSSPEEKKKKKFFPADHPGATTSTTTTTTAPSDKATNPTVSSDDDEVQVLTPTNTKKTYAAVTKPPATIWLTDDPAIITYGILPPLIKLQQQTSRSGSPSSSRKFLLTNSTLLQHIQQTDKWSCGFRNTQMLLSALVPLLPPSHPFFTAVAHIYGQVPDHVYTSNIATDTDLLVLPSLDQLQKEYERSWQEGFDPDGAKHFNHTLVGRQSWIGAVEVGFLFAFWRLDATVVQFIRCLPSRRLLPAFLFSYFQTAPPSFNHKTAATVRTCLDWAEQNYDTAKDKTAAEIFGTAATKTFETTILPLYLQWEGHSVTVVGIEPPPGNAATHRLNDWNQWNLLILCPSGASKSKSKQQREVLSCRTLGRMDCQLLVAGWNPLTQEEQLARKHKSASISAAKDVIDKLL